MLGLLQDAEANNFEATPSFPGIQVFSDLAAAHIGEALGPAEPDAEIHYQVIRCVFNTFHNHQRKPLSQEDDDEEENDEQQDEDHHEQDESVVSSVRISQSSTLETKEDKCRRIRKLLGKSLPADLIIEQRQEQERLQLQVLAPQPSEQLYDI